MGKYLSSEEIERRKKVVTLFLRAHYPCYAKDLRETGLFQYVLKLYGTLNNAKRSLGLPERPRNYVDPQKEQKLEYILQRRKEGISLKQIGEEFEEEFGRRLTSERVRQVIGEGGIEDPRRHYHVTPEEEKTFKTLKEKGMTLQQIAEETGRGHSTVSSHLPEELRDRRKYNDPKFYELIGPYHEQGLSAWQIAKAIGKPGAGLIVKRCLRYNRIKPYKLRNRRVYSIPEKDRSKIVDLYFVEGRTQSELAKRFKITQPTVSMIIRKELKRKRT